MMRNRNLHRLKRIKFRQSWNKYNLYNFARLPKVCIEESGTFFQQKWKAKALTRAYHGQQVREGQWERMFSPRLASVVPMRHLHLAREDGSEQGAGRGSGTDLQKQPKRILATPYMQMMYAPLERRLDTAIFRALFASSTTQARQFVVHGAVKVNGKKMIYPGYLLNPGDMFQVDPERVLLATGAPKGRDDRRLGRIAKRRGDAILIGSRRRQLARLARTDSVWDQSTEENDKEKKKEKKNSAEKDEEGPLSGEQELRQLVSDARAVLDVLGERWTLERKGIIRHFQQRVWLAISRGQKAIVSREEALKAQTNDILSRLGRATSDSDALSSSVRLSGDDRITLDRALLAVYENPDDPTKPYATPWRPRDYMSPFAFIPRFLEVNHRVCSAVYLRHPVARPSLTEVPTPFALSEYQLAFNWYLRRR